VLKDIVTIPRTANVFLRDSIVGITNPHVTGGDFLRLSITIVGIGFSQEIQTGELNTEEGDDTEWSWELHQKFLKECPICHAEVVKAVFGENDGDRQLGCN
jgi:hypothetical protein